MFVFPLNKALAVTPNKGLKVAKIKPSQKRVARSCSRAAAAALEVVEAAEVADLDYLSAIRCRVMRAVVLQEDAGRVALLACCLMGTPMVTQGLQAEPGR